jgi:outer membrane protein assembly factor BamB
LVIHVGCGNGELTAALCANDSYVVHGLDANAKNIDAARKHIRAIGLYGKVSVEQWTGKRLPYADNLANLVVSQNLGGVPMAEVLRVLAPNGVAYVESAGQWTKIVKPRGRDIDEWTHFLHDAGNNAVARDTVVGPPRLLQWMAPPLWLRSHETPSGVQALVCGGGRVFYFLDEGLIGITDQRLPERWALICRDAFNGKLLWRRPVEPWGWPQWAAGKFQDNDWTTITGGRTAVPDENQRRLVADGDRLYATLGYREPLAVLDAATGKTLAAVAETAPVRQIVAADGVAVVYSQAGAENAAAQRRRGKAKADSQGEGTLFAVRGTTGEVLWRHEIPQLRGLSLAIDRGRVVWQAAKTLACLDLRTGKELWQTEPQETACRTLVAAEDAVVLLGQKAIEVHDAQSGKLLWHKQVRLGSGLGSEDLFVIDGTVWPGILSVTADTTASGKSPNALSIGYDLRTGEERKRVFVPDLRSPEHHHRCYRNKATERYLISAMEGAEFLDLQGDGHSQNNFIRGACKLGVMPCNGMLYAPPDQCFCQPGAKLLGFAAVAPAAADPFVPVSDDRRLERGPAFGRASGSAATKGDSPVFAGAKTGTVPSGDWPTFRYDAARHGATPQGVLPAVQQAWRVKLGGTLTAPVCAGRRVFIASNDAHTLHALELGSGRPLWTFVTGGRIDSPPTVHNGLVLLGSADGWVYCLRADDGALVWRFLAAPGHRRVAVFDQLESAWPVSGSVLVREGVAYVAAGRSTYLDGGIRLWALDPASGKVLHQTTLSGPFPDGKTVPRDVSFFISGANTDVLVSEGEAIYMRQKRLTPSLQELRAEVLSSKGEADVGLHLFSTAGLLDGSWYNRTFWMYAKRWPGFQLANQAPKSGQLLVVDRENTYGVKVFYRRNVHSPMFFPGKEGYLLFADKNSTEPQIVGEKGARKPVAWLPQSEYGRKEGPRLLDSPAFGLDKMIGYTRAEPPLWTLWVPVRIRAMVKAGETLFVAGPPDAFDANDPYAAFEGRKGASLIAVSASDGKKLTDLTLDVPPVFDGLIAAHGRLLVALEDGSVACFIEQRRTQ